MATLWFAIVAFMLAVYVILDGFDFGVGILHHFIGRNERERELLLSTIGPVWDGNEVWLLAAGGTLYFAFPALYASAFSGFYLPLTIVLWLLVLRACAIELRHHVNHEMWRSFWDVLFTGSSLLLAIIFGAALGNVVRGVPLAADGYFFAPLWTSLRVVAEPGVLDWYTVLTGVVALVALATHGALYLAAKTRGVLYQRAQKAARIGWYLLLLLTVLSLVATVYVRPGVLDNFRQHVWGLIFPLLAVAGLFGMTYFRSRQRDGAAFFCSSMYLAGMLSGAAFALFPLVLPSSGKPEFSLTVYNAAAQPYGLKVGLVWWLIGITLAVGYFLFLYRAFRGRVNADIELEATAH